MDTHGTTPDASIGATRRLAEFATTTSLADVPDPVVERAKLVILDTIGVSLAALGLPIGRIVVEHAKALGGSPVAGVLGTDVATSAPLAAQANGTLAHGLDFDDHGHLSTHVLPSALAVAELTAASGAALLEAYLVGREVGARLSATIEAKRKQKLGPTYRGWYRVGVVGPIASAVAAAKVLGLGAEPTAHAIAIAASSASGLRRNLGTMTKALHAGNAAFAGTSAALLAARGFTADTEVIEAPLGLVNAVCLPGEADWSVLDRLGAPFELADRIAVKRYPACSPSHMPVHAVLRLRDRYGIKPDAVRSIRADLHEFSLLRIDPGEAIATGYSLPYLLAIALVDGAVGPDQVGADRLADPRVRTLMAKVVHDPAAAPRGGPERVTVVLEDGSELYEEIDRKPDLSDPAAITAKFVDCASRRLPPARVTEVREAVAGLASLTAAADLVRLTRPVATDAR